MIKRKLKRLPVIETYNGAKLHFDSGIYVSRDGKYLVKDGQDDRGQPVIFRLKI